MNVVTINDDDVEGVPAGSFIRDVVEVEVDGVKHWNGRWSSMAGTYNVAVKQSNAKVKE